MASVLAVSVVGGPAAFAADGRQPTAKSGSKLIAQTTLDKHWRRTKHVLRKKRQEADEPKAGPDAAVPSQLRSIAQCESHGDPHAIGGGGTYRGKYQFDMGTWTSVGGHGDPAAAPEAEQDKRAAILYSRSGPSQWPVCGV